MNLTSQQIIFFYLGVLSPLYIRVLYEGGLCRLSCGSRTIILLFFSKAACDRDEFEKAKANLVDVHLRELRIMREENERVRLEANGLIARSLVEITTRHALEEETARFRHVEEMDDLRKKRKELERQFDILRAEKDDEMRRRIEENSTRLAEEHMKKFREMTNKLVAEQENELESVRRENEAKLEEERNRFARSLEEENLRHQSELDEEMGRLQKELDDALDAEKSASEKRIEEMEREKSELEETHALDVASLRDQWENEKSVSIENLIAEHKRKLADGMSDFEKQIEEAKARRDEMLEAQVRRLEETGSTQIADVEKRLRAQIVALETEIESRDAAALVAEARRDEERFAVEATQRKEMEELEGELRRQIREGDERLDAATRTNARLQARLSAALDERKTTDDMLGERERKLNESAAHYERIVRSKDGEIEALENTVVIQRTESEKALGYVDRLLTALRDLVGVVGAVEEAVTKPVPSTAAETPTTSLQTDEGVCDTSRLSLTDTMLASTFFETSRSAVAMATTANDDEDEDEEEEEEEDLDALVQGRVVEANDVGARLGDAVGRLVDMLAVVQTRLKEANERVIAEGAEKVTMMTKHTEELQRLAEEREDLLRQLRDLDEDRDAVDVERVKREAAEARVRELDEAQCELVGKVEDVLDEIKAAGVDELKAELETERATRVRLSDELETMRQREETVDSSVVELDELKSQMADLQERFVVVETSLVDVRREKENVEEERERLRAEVTELQRRLDDEEETDVLRNELAREREENARQTSTIEQLKTDIAVLEERLEDGELERELTKETSEIETKLGVLQREKDERERELLRVVADYENHVKQRDDFVRDLETQLESSENAASRVTDALESAKEELVLTQRQLGETETECSDLECRSTEMEDRLRRWAATEMVYQRQIAALTEERASERRFSAYRRVVLEIVGGEAAEGDELEALRTTFAAKETMIDELRRRLRASEETMKERDRFVAEMEERFVGYKRKLAVLLGDVDGEGDADALEALRGVLASKQRVIAELQSRVNQVIGVSQARGREVKEAREEVEQLRVKLERSHGELKKAQQYQVELERSREELNQLREKIEQQNEGTKQDNK